ncbi:MAG: sulfatase-like hydrolase/transferase, partial [Akkermansiaceae bacterium]|nr:sulfatase-like hydrolase/transferase [Akkermansiaceae bacterium]
LPPYHPDTPVIRENWSRYFDNLWLMDQFVGEKLSELEESGEAGNTIVFYYADHGGALPRGKRNIHDSGTRVPLIIRLPEKWKHFASVEAGGWIEDPVAFVDFPATAANLCGLEIPGIWEGRPFLGPDAVKRRHVYLFRGRMDERYDTVRAIRTREYLYVKNFSPHRPCGQAYTYPFRVLASMGSWYEAFKAGECNEIQARYWKPKAAEELYRIKDDPFQTASLVGRPEHAAVLGQLRRTLMDEMVRTRDTGLIPEGMSGRLAGSKTIHDYARSDAFRARQVFSAAMLATSRDARVLETLGRLSRSESALERYWAATGCLVLGQDAGSLKDRLLALLEDSVFDVRVTAAEALGVLGETAAAAPVLAAVIKDGNEHESLAAINALEALGRSGLMSMAEVKASLPKQVRGDSNRVIEAIEKIR